MTHALVWIGAMLLWLQAAPATALTVPRTPAGTPRTLTLDDHDAIQSPDSLALSRDGNQPWKLSLDSSCEAA
jgi:hypothetical protein